VNWKEFLVQYVGFMEKPILLDDMASNRTKHPDRIKLASRACASVIICANGEDQLAKIHIY
jgi:hypothetical protein